MHEVEAHVTLGHGLSSSLAENVRFSVILQIRLYKLCL